MEETQKYLEDLGLPYELVNHKAVYTIDEAMAELPGRMEIKNLFIQDDKGKRQYLVCMPGVKKLDLKQLAGQLSEKKIRFCSPAKLMAMMGVTPGSVSLFCLMNPAASHVTLVVDRDLMEEKELGFHPLINTATIYIQHVDVDKLLGSFSNAKEFMQL
ncbi:MAG: Ala-tRNA(Pro) deacylase [Candidatus Saccharimonadales bacterium]|jgi:Ala-tRNA(Pro) deacylase